MATSTVGPSKTYTDLASWESTVGGSISADEIADCYGGADLGPVHISGWSMSGGARAIIRPASGEEHTSRSYDETQGPYVRVPSSNHGIQFSDPGSVTVDGIHVQAQAGALDCIRANNSSTNNWTIRNCVIDGQGTGPDSGENTGIYVFGNGGGNNGEVYNCAMYNCDRGYQVVYYDNSLGSKRQVRNCTFADNYDGVEVGGGASYDAPLLVNNIFANNTNDITLGGSSHDASSDYNTFEGATGTGGSNDTTSQTVSFVAEGSDDYGLSSQIAGTDLSGSFTTDALGVTRTGWSRGAFEYVSTLSREQEGFRFRNDDGSETAATWKAAQDTNATNVAPGNIRLRILTNVTGDAPSEGLKLQYRKAAGTWRDVPVGS